MSCKLSNSSLLQAKAETNCAKLIVMQEIWVVQIIPLLAGGIPLYESKFGVMSVPEQGTS